MCVGLLVVWYSSCGLGGLGWVGFAGFECWCSGWFGFLVSLRYWLDVSGLWCDCLGLGFLVGCGIVAVMYTRGLGLGFWCGLILWVCRCGFGVGFGAVLIWLDVLGFVLLLCCGLMWAL